MMHEPQIRKCKREEIMDFFAANIGKPIPSAYLHGRWGSATRTRISDINKDETALITIENETHSDDAKEKSVYRAKWRPSAAQQKLFGDAA